MDLKTKIRRREAGVAVVGLGYVGLPLAVSFAEAGFSVAGVDTDGDRIARIERGESYILDVAADRLRKVRRAGRFTSGTDSAPLARADVVLICVPTPLKKKYTPDISYILGAVRLLGRHMKKGTLVVLESTTYPGTTRELIQPELSRGGLRPERDFFLAFSPERIDPGNARFDVTRIPKVVGGLSRRGGELAAELYRQIITTVHVVSSAETAEMTKLLENSFRIINIGWINEVAMMCDILGIDVWEVIEAAKTKPFGFMAFYPGLGVGGHCIPDDPLYLFWRAKKYGFNSKYIKLSADTNAAMPAYALRRIERMLSRDRLGLAGARILVLGVTYKKDVKDLRKSPALRLIGLLERREARVEYHDPYIPYLDIAGIKKQGAPLRPAVVKGCDLVVVATDHTAVDYRRVRRHARRIFDIRNVYAGVTDPKIVRL